MYALGLTTRQIQDYLKEMYAAGVSPELISRVTDGVKDLAAEWRGGNEINFHGQNISKKWTMPVRDWGTALNQFAII
jgi:transposase-like protein